MDTESQTRDRIVLAALTCFFAQGIKKTTVDDIAQQVGLTRMTVYRHFKDKGDLVRAAFMRIEEVFQQAHQDLIADPQPNLKEVLNQIGRGLNDLPSGDLTTRLAELKQVYPSIYEEFQAFRLKAVGGVFDTLFAIAEARGFLREGLNRPFVQALFWEALVNLFENPHLRDLGLSNTEMFTLFTDILLYGILKQ